MTIPEAIRRVKAFGLYHAIGDLPHSVRTVEAFELAINELEKADKYKWHDLRKNPNDLPETFVEVWICFTDYKCCGDEKFYEKACRREEDWCWQGDDTLLNERYDIIAWKEIERFEEVKDNDY